MRKTKLYLLLSLVLYSVVMPGLRAQKLALSHPLSSQVEKKQDRREVSIIEALDELSQTYDVFFTYNTSRLKVYRVSTEYRQAKNVKSSLKKLLKKTNLQFKERGKNNFVIVEKTEPRLSNQRDNLPPPNRLVPIRAQRMTAVEKTITGQVTDLSTGETLPGVNIVVKGTTLGTVTDVEGNYRLTAPDDTETLVFSSVGYTSEEVAIGGQTIINLKMAPDIQSLSEVIVVGYGTQQRRDLTGSVASIDQEELQTQKTTSVDQMLQGRVAGVQVTQTSAAPGGGASIRIRGGNSIVGGNEPLYVVDGFPLYSSTTGNRTNPLATLDPSNIVSVEILKDASATAIYGSRGANGVVLITTKSGQSGKGQIELDFYQGVQEVINPLDLLSGRELAILANERAENDGLDPFFDSVDEVGNTDWQDQIFQVAPITNANLTFSGGNDKTTYSVSGGYFNQEGVVVESDLERGTFRVNLNQYVNDALTVTTNLMASKTVNNRLRINRTSLENPINSATIASPTIVPLQEDGSYTDLQDYALAPPVSNPLALANDITTRTEITRVIGTSAIEYAFLDNFKVTGRLGVDYNDFYTDNYLGRSVRFGQPAGSATTSTNETTSYLTDLLLNYEDAFGDHSISALIGGSRQTERQRGFQAGSNGFVSDDLENNDLSAGEDIQIPTSNTQKWMLLSGFGRLNYIFKDKYLITLTARADGSSKFGSGNKWGFFPSGSVAWRLGDEDFVKNLNLFQDLKLRVSYGLSGNQEIGSYGSLERISTLNYVLGTGDQAVVGLAPVSIANPDLKWETTSQFNIGTDFSMLDGRLSFTFDYYQKQTRDLLVAIPLPPNSGFSSALQNVGEMKNQGFEGAVNAVVVDKALNWTVGGNLSFNRNEVVALSNSGEFFSGALSSPISTSVNLVRVGEPLGILYGFETEPRLDDAGDIIYRDLNGDESITGDDRTIIGDPYPDFIYGLNSNLAYRGFDLSFFIQGVSSIDIFNFNRSRLTDLSGQYNQLSIVKDRWSTSNPDRNAAFPRVTGATTLRASDRLVEDASFMRLKNITLGYNFSSNSNSFLRKARIYVTAQNLITVTDYSGYDPEVDTFGGGTNLSIGIDAGTYPNARMYLLGIQVGL